ncbi:YtxH domain-containing protein [bacterium]
MSSNNDSSFSAFVLGGLIGATLGILFAPRKGEETREMVSKFIDDLHDKSIDTAQKTRDRAKKMYEEGRDIVQDEKDRINSVIDAGKKAFSKPKEKK